MVPQDTLYNIEQGNSIENIHGLKRPSKMYTNKKTGIESITPFRFFNLVKTKFLLTIDSYDRFLRWNSYIRILLGGYLKF